MIIIILVIVHWYSSLFFQTFFLHRYAAHAQFSMSKKWERAFYMGAWLSQGFTALSPNTYGKFHRMHHAYADTEKDVHSPKYDKSFVAMMLRTDKIFRGIRLNKIQVEEKFSKNLPWWSAMERFAYTPQVRIAWVAIYLLTYFLLVPSTALWLWFLLPLHLLMTPLQGAIINWCAHLFGYTNHEVSDTSKNLAPFDLLMMGEGYHNNHHAHPASPKFSEKWYEVDPVYPIIRMLNAVNIIELRK